MTASALQEADIMVTVRLSQVPTELRFKVAGMIVARAGLTGDEALDLMVAAAVPKQDPSLLVTAEKAELVLVAGKLPGGATPRVWLEPSQW